MYKKISAFFLSLMLCISLSACGKDANIATIERIVTRMYTAPFQELVDIRDVAATLDEDEIQEKLSSLFDDKIAQDYLWDFQFNVVYPFSNFTLQFGSSIKAESVTVKSKDDNNYEYTVEVLCTDKEGTETNVTASGTIRMNDEGLVENVNIHGLKELQKAIMKR